MPGGKAPVRNADKDSQEVADSAKGDVEAKVGKKYDQFQVVCYRTQVVAGINYYIKVIMVTHINLYAWHSNLCYIVCTHRHVFLDLLIGIEFLSFNL